MDEKDENTSMNTTPATEKTDSYTDTNTPSTYDFRGTWHSVYHYTSSQKPGTFTSEYDVRFDRIGNQLVVHSLPNDDKSYILLRLTLDGRIATGTWHEETSPTGDYKGVICYGALQLVLSEDGNAWRGKWVGFSRTMEVYTNEWVITRTAAETDEPASAA